MVLDMLLIYAKCLLTPAPTKHQLRYFAGITLPKVKVADKAPDFTLQSQSGEGVTLSGFFGKRNVVLYFYPEDESPGCTKEACSFRDAYEYLGDAGAEVIGINAGSVESHKSFAAHHNLPFILLSDKENNVRKLYGVPSTLGLIPGRVTYIIDKQGIVRHIFSSQFQPVKHVEEALRILKNLEQSQS
jgi:peroxiredoxin Q/BCP